MTETKQVAGNTEHSTLQRIGDILADVADIFGLGHRVVREVEDLMTDESAKRAMAETSARAEEIRQSRTRNAGGPK